MFVQRHVPRASACLLACTWLLSCNVYDQALLQTDANVPAHDANVAPPDASHGKDAATCTAAVEICNNIDDDCDGMVDEAASVQMDCAMKVQNASSICQAGKCVYLRECNPGFFNCDGRPENGCEAHCPCAAGCDDSGANDAG